MTTIAYLANQFPSGVESYVMDEITDLRGRGIQVIAGSVLPPRREDEALAIQFKPEVVLQAVEGMVVLHALWLCLRRWKRIAPLVRRVMFGGREGLLRRLKTLIHTWVGAAYAVSLQGRGVDYIHVHHGYFGSWVGMVAARLLDVPFSMTLHGSDLLLYATYLDTKLEHCAFCRAISEYNRQYILQHYPEVEPEKVLVLRLGVDVAGQAARPVVGTKTKGTPLLLLAVGRLHPVKDHAFLLRACANLVARDVAFHCCIAGDGPEHSCLESMIRTLGLEGCVTLLGHVPPTRRNSLYAMADVVVLTSRSEGIPVVLMEAMARGKIVLAPAITGIPELVIAGKTGFLYEPGSMDDFVAHLLLIRSLMQRPEGAQQQFPAHSAIESLALERIRHAARVHVRQNFNRRNNLQLLAELFLQRIAPQTESIPDESPLLQQI